MRVITKLLKAIGLFIVIVVYTAYSLVRIVVISADAVFFVFTGQVLFGTWESYKQNWPRHGGYGVHFPVQERIEKITNAWTYYAQFIDPFAEAPHWYFWPWNQ